MCNTYLGKVLLAFKKKKEGGRKHFDYDEKKEKENEGLRLTDKALR